MEVVVTGIGLASALGRLEPSWQTLLRGESAIQQHQPFLDFPSRPLALIGHTPTSLETLTELVVAEALQDAGLVPPLPDCGIVIGSSRSCQASWEQLAKRLQTEDKGQRDFQSPIPSSLKLRSQFPIPKLEHWLDTLPHYAAITTARKVGSKASVLAPMAACATGIWAIAQGFELIQSGQCQQVLAGAVEAPITPLTLAGFEKMGALARTGSYPFDQNREGLVLGEGGAVLVLESAKSARERSASIYGKVLGFGLTCDAYHVSAPEPGSNSGLSKRGTMPEAVPKATIASITAVKQCLERSHLSATDIDYIHAHGTGTQLNDHNEAQLIEWLFPHRVPISSTKGATGHTLGASGALGAAFCLMALKYQQLPPCVGLKEPAFDLDFVTTPRQAEINSVLCFSFGFGGQNTVMALSQMP
ncbi:beta-ketoacyl-ACP synthase [Microcoleus sp. FACHB-SPT15]|uniref:beta-ketoacyl-ACP synthase n=1 Tax=Microcoleus sp. FACHB-SPT15 TaxID=2692830 RepID=UPI0028C40F08|nr:beta-ketoacyl-ACP synthase [Microcoleus sp. FACHB-SPT15]